MKKTVNDFNSKINVIGHTSTSTKHKKQKIGEHSSITLGHLHTRKGSRKTKHLERLRILFDSGCAHTIVNNEATAGPLKMPNKSQQWKMKGGTFNTSPLARSFSHCPCFTNTGTHLGKLMLMSHQEVTADMI